MRKRIRLTGRKQLARSSVEAKVVELGSKKLVTLALADPKAFQKFPKDSRVKLRLFENKFSETLEFGTLGAFKPTADLRNGAFTAPSCQLRIVASNAEKKGLLLGSTDTWTLKADNDDPGEGSDEGILLFQPSNIFPRSWKLDVREDEHPIVYIDERIPDSRTWVRTNPIFLSCVLPAVIREIFEDILDNPSEPDARWMKEWLQWADSIMPGRKPPFGEGRKQKQGWTDDLLDSFCQRHGLLDRLLGHLHEGAEPS